MRLSWDSIDERLYRDGADHGVLYVKREPGYDIGVPWNGITGIDDNVSGRELTSLYTNDIRARLLKTKPERGGTIKCFTYPPEFEECLGGDEINTGLVLYDQEETPFGVTYRSKIGNAVDGIDHAEIVYIYYGLNITSTTQNVSTIGAEVDPDELSFAFTSIPEPMTDHDPVSLLTFRSDRVFDMQWERLLDTLYGTDETDPTLPYPDDLLHLLEVVVVSGKVIWDDNNNADGLRPDHLHISLYKDVNGTKTLADQIIVTAETNWHYTFNPQFRYEGDTDIVFSVSGVYGQELITEAGNRNFVTEGVSYTIGTDDGHTSIIVPSPVFKLVTEEYWPCRYDETIDGFVLTETRADDPLE